MNQKGIPNNLINLILLVVFGIVASFLLFKLYENFHQAEVENQNNYLQQALDRTVIEFQDEMDKYGLLVTSLRSHIYSLGRIPTDKELQEHIINQLKYSDYAHSLIINYIDTTNTFIYSISETDLTPNNLKGVQITSFRDSTIIKNMQRLLSSDEIIVFPPINLVEGFVGLPLDFSIRLDGTSYGYITPIINIKNILNPIFEKDVLHEFTYRFSYGNNIVFDREQVFNNTEVHHVRKDTLNMNLPAKRYITSTFDSFGMDFNVGIAYRDTRAVDYLSSFVETSWAIILGLFLLLALVSILLLQLLFRTQELRTSLGKISSMNDILIKFNSAISHELRQPLNKINSFVELFKKKDSQLLTEEGNVHMKDISATVEQMNILMDDFLKYTDAMEDTDHKESVSLNEIIEDVQSIYEKANVKLLSEPLPDVIGNKGQLHQLFQNLISNAVKFNENEKISIIVSSNIIDDDVEIRVSDNGIGVKPEYLESIFQDFLRRNKDQYPGTGLGLPLCKEIVKNHGGDIKAEINIHGGLDVIFQLEIGEELNN